MSLSERRAAIAQLEQVRGSKVLVHVLSDRRVAPGVPIPGLTAIVAAEAYPFIYRHLRLLGKVPKLDLVLHTSGGHLDSVWPIVRLCRSFAEEFSVLVPMRAFSAGTLICLGANQVVMGDAAQLSPVDPTTQNPFNPRDPQGNPVPISVEDVTSYVELARSADDKGKSRGAIGLKSDDMVEVFKALIANVHPLALGNVKRVQSQIRSIATRLLELHISGDGAKERIEKIVRTLTEELYSHSHFINRSEAADILGEDMVPTPSTEEHDALWGLYEVYERELELINTFNVNEFLGGVQERELDATGGFIESSAAAHTFRATSMIRLSSVIPPNVQVQIPFGQPLPLIPGAPTQISVEPRREGWYANVEAINA